MTSIIKKDIEKLNKGTEDIEGKELVFKAQMPLGGNDPSILIYPDKTRTPWIFMPVTEEMYKILFNSRYCKVYFRGVYKNNEITVTKFVRHGEWL